MWEKRTYSSSTCLRPNAYKYQRLRGRREYYVSVSEQLCVRPTNTNACGSFGQAAEEKWSEKRIGEGYQQTQRVPHHPRQT